MSVPLFTWELMHVTIIYCMVLRFQLSLPCTGGLPSSAWTLPLTVCTMGRIQFSHQKLFIICRNLKSSLPWIGFPRQFLCPLRLSAPLSGARLNLLILPNPMPTPAALDVRQKLVTQFCSHLLSSQMENDPRDKSQSYPSPPFCFALTRVSLTFSLWPAAMRRPSFVMTNRP